MELGFQKDNLSISLDPVMLYRYATDIGSALATRYQYRSLEEVTQAANNAVDLDYRKFTRGDMVRPHHGSYIDGRGNVVPIKKGSAFPKDEQPTPYGTIIMSLSAQMSRTQLGPIVAKAIIFAIHGANQIGPNEATQVSLIEGTVAKYAGTVMSADSMFNTRAIKKKSVEEDMARRFPHMFWHTLFLPTKLPSEEIDYALFLSKMLSRTADDEVIYIRSMKLLGLALMLFEYGWMLNISIEMSDGSTRLLRPHSGSAVGALAVVLSFAPSTSHSSRSYLENHTLRLKPPLISRNVWRTAISSAGNMSEALSLTVTENPGYARAYQRGFDKVKDIWHRDWTIGPLLRPGGLIRVELLPRSGSIRETPISEFDKKSSSRFMDHFIGTMPRVCMDVVTQAMADLYPGNDWESLLQEGIANTTKGTPLSYMTTACKGDASKLWMAQGAIAGLVDSFARAVINVPDDSQIRFPVDLSDTKWEHTIAKLVDKGLTVDGVVRLCAFCYAGVQRSDGLRSDLESGRVGVLGYWNGEQGILPTPVFERTLYCDLPNDKARPLTLHNKPIIGMATDDSGWIRPGREDSSHDRMTPAESLPKTVMDPACSVVIEYRPHFEREINNVVAGVYIGGMYFGTMPLDESLNCDNWDVSSCPPDHSEDPSRAISTCLKIDLNALEAGEMILPSGSKRGERLIALLLPQTSSTSRFFSGALTAHYHPVYQTGCLQCAVETAERNRRNFIIPMETISTTAMSRV